MESFYNYAKARLLNESLQSSNFVFVDYLDGGIPNFGGPGYWKITTDKITGKKVKVENDKAFSTPPAHAKKAMRYIGVLQPDGYIFFGKMPTSTNLQDASDKVHDYLENEVGDDTTFSWIKTSQNIINYIGSRDCDSSEYMEVCKLMAKRSGKIEYKKAIAEGDSHEDAMIRAKEKYYRYINNYSIKSDSSVSGVGVDNTINYRYN
jgi:hypothetical protein